MIELPLCLRITRCCTAAEN